MSVDQAALDQIRLLLADKRFADADAACWALIAQDSENAGLWRLRGVVATHAQDWRLAKVYLQRAVMMAPDTAAAWLDLSRARASNHEPDQAGLAAITALDLGLGADDAALATELVAAGLFAQSKTDAARGVLADLAIHYRRQLSELGDRLAERASQALAAAICADDKLLTCDLLVMRYPWSRKLLSQVAISPISTLKAWCAKHGAAYRVLHEPENVEIENPGPFSRAYSYNAEAIVMASIPGGRWAPGWDFAIAPDGAVLSDSGYMPLHSCHNFWPHVHFAPLELVAHHAPDDVVHVDDEVLLLSTPCDSNFGHWVIDFLTRLPARAALGRKQLKIAVAGHVTSKFRDTLRLFGVKDDDVIQCRNDATYHFRMLHVYRPGRSMPPHPRHVHFLRDHFYGLAPTAPRPGKGRRVFLDRSSVGTRMVINAEEFNKLLAEEGFETIDLARTTIADQRTILADAEVLLATMGTDLLALYFAPHDCTVMGIIDDPALDPLIAQTCGILGMAFQFIVAKAESVSGLHRHSRDVNFRVDCVALQQRLRDV